MYFNSFDYLLFLPCVISLYVIIPVRLRWLLMLIASYYFYMSWKPIYIVLIVGSTVVDYWASNKIAVTDNKKKYLYISLLINLGLLFVFKYLNFCIDNVLLLQGKPIPGPKEKLISTEVVGISFYTFQTLSYTIDVYKGKLKPEKNIFKFALYVSFFPQLVAGPIERATHLLPQLKSFGNLQLTNFREGMRLILWGMVKKVVIADRLAIYVNAVYNNASDYHGLPVILATYFFAFQIYCDFSGYSDIAIGTARIFGIDLMDNFKNPYGAKSLSDFWRRWHISLSTWFKDYVYIPLGGNRVKSYRRYVNLMIVFVVSGIWHGANWQYLIWGFIHAIFIFIEVRTQAARSLIYRKLPWLNVKILKQILVFHIVLLAWVFFRANTIDDAFKLILSMKDIDSFSINILGDTFNLMCSLICVMILFTVDNIGETGYKLGFLSKTPSYLRMCIYIICVLALVFLGVYNENQFIYFQF